MTSRIGLFLLLASATVFGQSADPTAGDSTRGYRQAVENAKAELAKIREQNRVEAEAIEEKILAENSAVVELAERQATLRQQLEQLIDEEFAIAGKIQDAEREVRTWDNQLDALWSELRTQAIDLQDRFHQSIVEREFPELLAPITPIAEAPSEVPADLESMITALLGVYERVVTIAGSARTFESPVQLSFAEGRIAESDVLRLGLLGGFYRNATASEAGFLKADEETQGLLVGRAEGLSAAQQAAIDGLVAAPADGGTIPFDVTGGAGLASLQAADDMQTWFEKGGKFMWPLLIVAALAFVIILERAIALALRTRGIQSRIRKLLDLVEAGRIEEAEKQAERKGGAVGRVFHAALVHRNQDRSVMEDAVQEALLHETPSFQKRLAFIALCAAVAPLMGLLGTVTGMITTFKMVTIFGTSDPRFMAGGISEALITTQGGLYLAIPCLLCRGILGAVADSAMGRLETGAMSSVLAILKHQEAERMASDGEHDPEEPAPTLEFDAEEGDGEDSAPDRVESLEEPSELIRLRTTKTRSADSDSGPIEVGS